MDNASARSAPRRVAGRGRGSVRSKSTTRPGPQESMASTDQRTSSSNGQSADPMAAVTSGMAGLSVGQSQSTAPASVEAASIVSIQTEGSKSSQDEVALAERPTFGRSGRPIQLRTNFFKVEMQNRIEIVQYRVEIRNDFLDKKERKSKKEENFEIFWKLVKEYRWTDDIYSVIYDGGNTVMSLKPLNVPREYSTTIDHTLPGHSRPSKFSVNFSEIGKKIIDFRNLDSKVARQLSLTVLDLIWRQSYNYPLPQGQEKAFYPYGRSFHNAPSPGDRSCFDLDAGRQNWSGYYFSAKWGIDFVPLLNVDIANAVFFKKQPFLNFMCDVLNAAAGSNSYHVSQLEALTTPITLKQSEIAALSKAIKGYSVTTLTTPFRQYKVKGVTQESANRLTFEIRKGEITRQITVANYFAEKNVPLRYPFFPCLETVGKRSALLPIEICQIHTPQKVRGKLTESQTSAMIRGVCVDAAERELRITNIMYKAGMAGDNFAQKYGIQLNTTPVQLTGRVLEPPALQYMPHVITPNDGSWVLRNSKLHFGAKIGSYGFISFVKQNQINDMADFCRALMTMGVQMGMSIARAEPDSVKFIARANEIRDAIHTCISDCASKGLECDLILFPMPSKNVEAYATVKSIAEKEYGIATQIILLKNMRPIKPMTMSNIILKINTKLGGINCKLVADAVTKNVLVDQPTLILGLDVTHPSPGDRSSPSIGAAVGNIDTVPGKFAASICIQQHRQESVVYLSAAIRDRVIEFHQRTGRAPERIIMYRDGVAEGQFKEIMKEEMKSLRQTLDQLMIRPCPKITFIVVQKRHHTRFFCQNDRDQCGRGKNVPPGTVVDNVITEPDMFDFYLCSHFGIQGTSRPTHYYVLHDDSRFKPDELQAVTYHLCHIYARCTRAVSIPTPTYYAHLACERAKHHLKHGCGIGMDDDSLSQMSEGAGIGISEDMLMESVRVADKLRSTPYFV